MYILKGLIKTLQISITDSKLLDGLKNNLRYWGFQVADIK